MEEGEGLEPSQLLRLNLISNQNPCQFGQPSLFNLIAKKPFTSY